ncbi:hypothetical protein N836_30410 [Leptolyngbya sp. Heron Island J]|nr:hypothetical protein N836_30410 [Leptolyngbya sp. Heron Island J]
MYGFSRQLRKWVGFTVVTRVGSGACLVGALTMAIAKGDKADGDKGGCL